MGKRDLHIDPPLMNAPGFLGFAPRRTSPVELSRLGAFVTNPVSLEKRTPAANAGCIGYPGGFLLHTGHPNPGFRSVLRRYTEIWARSPVPVIVHLLVREIRETLEMASRLDGLEGVMGIELGLPREVQAVEAAKLVGAWRGELPLIVRLPMDRAEVLAPALAEALPPGAEIAAFSLGAPRGALLDERRSLLHGRLYGPGLFPQALATVRALAKGGTPVIGGGGVYHPEQVEVMLSAGAAAVQLDGVLWKGSWEPEAGG